MDALGSLSPSLPPYIIYPIAALSAVIILLALVRMKHIAGGFLIFAVWLRYVMQAIPSVTYKPLVAGMSAAALASTAVAVLGLFTIKLKNLALQFLLPFYLLIIVTVISAVVNQSFGGLLGVLTKYLYLIVFTVGVYEALQKHPDGRFMRLFLWAFVPPLLYQGLSVVMGLGKATESDFSVSYIGGYNHEANFSVIIATCAVVAALTTRMNKLWKTVLIVIAIGGIYLANYRTTILAMAPLIVFYFGLSPIGRVVKRDRPVVVGVAVLLISLALGLASLFLATRFADINTAASGDINLFKPPYAYTDEEARILSGRPMIWAGYIYAWLQGSGMQQVFGFGPETWRTAFSHYAHNTLVNTLYEYGIVGVLAMLFMWGFMLVAALRVRHPNKGVLLGAHISFLFLNMGTMPLWMIEGNVLYGVICGYTLYLLSAPQEAPARAKQQRRRAQPMQPYPTAPQGQPRRPAA